MYGTCRGSPRSQNVHRRVAEETAFHAEMSVEAMN